MDYDAFLEKAMKIFNEKMGTDFSADNIVLRCLTTEDQMEVFQSFCTDYFPDRLKDRYEDEGTSHFVLLPSSAGMMGARMVSFSEPTFPINRLN